MARGRLLLTAFGLGLALCLTLGILSSRSQADTSVPAQGFPAQLPGAQERAPLQGPYRGTNSRISRGIADVATDDLGFSSSADLAEGEETILALSIVSAPWAPLDSNDPTGLQNEVPKVFVVQAVVTNTGTITATSLRVNLDYNEDPSEGWLLLTGEDPLRSLDNLPPGGAYDFFWLAGYSTVIGASHQYTVEVDAANADPVATSDNYYGNPSLNRTVQTRGALSTGNSGIVRTETDVEVGVALTLTVEYDLGNDPQALLLSPVGNVDFDAGAFRLQASTVRFYDEAETNEQLFNDRLYYPAFAEWVENAIATYYFVVAAATESELCPYGAVDYGSSVKYDRFFCSSTEGTKIPINSSLTLSLSQQANRPAIQQSETLTYTIRYTNTGDAPMMDVWVWGQAPIDVGSIISTSVYPPGDPAETADGRVAWFLGDVPAGHSGALTFSVLVDGRAGDLPDNTPLISRAFAGVNQGSLPANPLLTRTVTTTIEAPRIRLGVTDGRDTSQPGDALTYTLRITNSGSVTATGVVITQLLPVDVTPAGPVAPAPDRQVGQALIWISADLVPPNGGSLAITVSAELGPRVPNDTVLDTAMTVRYENAAGYLYATKSAVDRTAVEAPVLSVSASDVPDPVIAGRSITYTLHYTNSGPVPATNVLITDVLPAGIAFQTCAGGSVCGLSDGVVSWTVGTVPAKNSGQVSFSVLIADQAAAGTLIRNEMYGIRADQTDVVLGPPVTTLVYPDSDGDGIPDAYECPGISPCPDSDDDGAPDYLDSDDDGDGIPTADECSGGPPCADNDGDGARDYLDGDDDDDGIPTLQECLGGPPCADSDSDGLFDFLDPDSDGDGISDAGEWSVDANDRLSACHVADPICLNNDVDRDGDPNYRDLDSDADGSPDMDEGLKDSDEDGIPDWLDAKAGTNSSGLYVFLPLVIRGP